MVKLALWAVRIFIAVSVPFLLVIASVRIVMTPLFLQIEYTRPGFLADPYGFSIQDRLTYGPLGVNYILNREDISFLSDLTLPGQKCWPAKASDVSCSMFNERELQHMVDVKNVAQAVFLIAMIDFLLLIGLFLLLWRPHRNHLLIGLRDGSLATLGIIIAIIFVAFVAWDMFFNLFHALFFTEGTWQFLYSDTLIRLYPEQFWFEAALVVGGLTSLGAMILFLYTRRMTHLQLA